VQINSLSNIEGAMITSMHPADGGGYKTEVKKRERIPSILTKYLYIVSMPMPTYDFS
jgi:hypothetical protein